MSKFLLLRSNKQTGPYTADELRQMGLKAYDLIWVDGKSAAWRYPGEVDELKSFAPPVEEQPYDRFYKKQPATVEQPAAEQQQATEVPRQPEVTAPAISTPPPATPSTRKEKEYKRVFVTLPNGAPATRPVIQRPVQEQKPVPEPVYTAPVNEYQAPAAQPAFSKPAAEKKSEPSEIYHPQKKKAGLRGMMVVGVIAAMMAMIGVGIVIGLSLDPKQTTALNSNAANQGPSASEASLPVNNVSQPVTEFTPAEVPSAEQLNEQIPPAGQQPVLNNGAEKPGVKKAAIPQPADTNLQKITPIDEPQPEVEKKEEPVKKPVAKPAPSLEKHVAVSTNDYEVGPFGGISKLAFTVKNSSEHDISLVVVQVDYLKANKEVFKTENLYFRDLAANSSLTLDAPRSSRGNKVNYKVTLINSKDHIYHAGN